MRASRCILAVFAVLVLSGLVPSASAVKPIGDRPVPLCPYEDGPCIREEDPYGTWGIYVCTSPDNCLETVNDGTGCRIADIYGTDPAISTNPVLGLIVVDPDNCFDERMVLEYADFAYTGAFDVVAFAGKRLFG